MFSVRFTIILCLSLFVPFYLRYRYPALEAYPAVLMPVGAFTVRQDSNQIAIKYRSLYGLDQNSNWQRVDPQLFMKPIPVQYLYDVSTSIFNLNTPYSPPFKKKNGIAFRFLNTLHLLDSSNKSEQDKAKLKVWVQNKLREQGLTGTALKEVTSVEMISSETEKIVAKKDIDEKVIQLNQ